MVGTLSVSLSILATGPVTQPPCTSGRGAQVRVSVGSCPGGRDRPDVLKAALSSHKNKAGPGNAVLLPRSF